MNEQAPDRNLHFNKRVTIWRLWVGPSDVATGTDETRDEWLVRFDPPRVMASATWRDGVMELAADGFVDADVIPGNRRLVRFALTDAGRKWAHHYFGKTREGRKEHRRFQKNMQKPLAERDPRAPRQYRGQHAKPPSQKTLDRLFEGVRRVGVADGDDVVVKPRVNEPIYETIGNACGWSRRSVSVVISGMERGGDQRIRVSRSGRAVLEVRLAGIGGGRVDETWAAMVSPVEPVETIQRMRPESDSEAEHEFFHAMHLLVMAFQRLTKERDDLNAMLDAATAPEIDPQIQEIIDAVGRLRLSE